MSKAPPEITLKAHEIYAHVSASKFPIRVLSQVTSELMDEKDWSLAEIEQVRNEVLDLLIAQGWKTSD